MKNRLSLFLVYVFLFVPPDSEAGCTPFASSLIADYFVPGVRGVALGVYNIGIYAGYSMSYAFGDFITAANINDQVWIRAIFMALEIFKDLRKVLNTSGSHYFLKDIV